MQTNLAAIDDSTKFSVEQKRAYTQLLCLHASSVCALALLSESRYYLFCFIFRLVIHLDCAAQVQVPNEE